MRRLFTISFILLSQFAIGGIHYTWGTHSGFMGTINGSTAFGSPVTHGDTVQITGAFSSMPDLINFAGGISGDSIVIDLRGATWTSTSYTQTTWENLNFIKILGGRTLNYYYGNCNWSQKVYNIRVSGMNLTNQFGHYQNGQIAFQIGASSSNATPYNFMTYTHNSQDLTTTFHGVRFDNDTFNGFTNTTPIAVINDGAHNLVLDFEFDHNTCRNITSLSPGTGITGGSPGLLSGVILNFNIHHNDLDSFNANIGACQCTHSEWFFLVGYGKVEYNSFYGSFGSGIRGFPMVYAGIAGKGNIPGNALIIDNNYDKNLIAYSFAEANNTGVASNLISLGFTFTRTYCYYNTLDSTNIDVTDASHPTTKPFNPFESAVMSIYADSVSVWNNTIIHQAKDTFPDGLYKNVAITNSNGHSTGRDTAGNQVWLYYTGAGIDSNNYPNLLSTSPLRVSTANKTAPSNNNVSYNGVTRAAYPNNGVGAIYYSAGGSPPSCVTNISPGNGTTVAGQTSAALSWNSDGTATSYDLYFDGAFLLNQSGTTYTKTGLSANTSHTFYAIPRNATGPAVSCSGNSTSFTTASVPIPSCVTNTLPTAGSTIGTTTTASLAWNSDAAATSYSVYLYLNGGSIPGTPTTTISGATYSATGLTAGLVYKFFVIPNSTGGSASGCSTNATIFSTAAIGHPVKILTVRRK
jgi:hypothetical protein